MNDILVRCLGSVLFVSVLAAGPGQALADIEPWPGLGGVNDGSNLDQPYEVSGAFYNAHNGDLWVVNDGNGTVPSCLTLLDGNTVKDQWYFPGRDLEAVTLPDPEFMPNQVLLLSENTPAIIWFDATSETTVVEHSLAAWYSGYGNQGPEALAVEKHEQGACDTFTTFVSAQADNYIRVGAIDIQNCHSYDFLMGSGTTQPAFWQGSNCDGIQYNNMSDLVVTESPWGEPMLWALYDDTTPKFIRIMNTDGDCFEDYYTPPGTNAWEALAVDFEGCRIWIGNDTTGTLKRYIFPTMYSGCQIDTD